MVGSRGAGPGGMLEAYPAAVTAGHQGARRPLSRLPARLGRARGWSASAETSTAGVVPAQPPPRGAERQSGEISSRLNHPASASPAPDGTGESVVTRRSRPTAAAAASSSREHRAVAQTHLGGPRRRPRHAAPIRVYEGRASPSPARPVRCFAEAPRSGCWSGCGRRLSLGSQRDLPTGSESLRAGATGDDVLGATVESGRWAASAGRRPGTSGRRTGRRRVAPSGHEPVPAGPADWRDDRFVATVLERFREAGA